MLSIFETERLIVRRYAAEDFEHFFRLNGDEEVVRYIRPVQNREQAKESFEKVLTAYDEQPGRGRWGVFSKANGEFAGSFAIIPIPWDQQKIQMGYAFPKENWGKGFATELTVKGLEHFWASTTVPEIYGVTEIPNVASQKVLLKAGFVFWEIVTENGIALNVYISRRKQASLLHRLPQ
ncbi:MAG TPA: GNAT family N-acetyltransferase [Chitinophagaceae bacterium]